MEPIAPARELNRNQQVQQPVRAQETGKLTQPDKPPKMHDVQSFNKSLTVDNNQKTDRNNFAIGESSANLPLREAPSTESGLRANGFRSQPDGLQANGVSSQPGSGVVPIDASQSLFSANNRQDIAQNKRPFQTVDGHRITGQAFEALSPPKSPGSLPGAATTIQPPFDDVKPGVTPGAVAYGIGSAAGLVSGLATGGAGLGLVASLSYAVGSGTVLGGQATDHIRQYNPNIDYNNLSEHGQTVHDLTQISGGARYLSEHLRHQTNALSEMTKNLNGQGQVNTGRYLLASLNSGAAISGQDSPLFGSTDQRNAGNKTDVTVQTHPALGGILPFQAAHTVPGVELGDRSHSIINSFISSNGSRVELNGLQNKAQQGLDRVLNNVARENSAAMTNIGQGITDVSHSYFNKELPKIEQTLQAYNQAKLEYDAAKASAYRHYFGTDNLSSISEEQATNGIQKIALESGRGPGAQGYYGIYNSGENLANNLRQADSHNQRSLDKAATSNNQVANFYQNDVNKHVADLWSSSTSVRLKNLDESPHTPLNAIRVLNKKIAHSLAPEKTGYRVSNDIKEKIQGELQHIVDQNQKFFGLIANPAIQQAGFSTKNTESNFNLQDNFSRIRRTEGIRNEDWSSFIQPVTDGSAKVVWNKDFTNQLSEIRTGLVNRQKAYANSTNGVLELSVRDPFNPGDWHRININ